MRTRLGIIAATAVFALTGCAAPPGAPATPDPRTPDPSASAVPRATAAPTPTASPFPAATPTSSAEPASAAPYCGDAYALFLVGDDPLTVGSTDAEMLELVDPGFEPADAIAGLDVHCTVTFHSTPDGSPGPIATISEALLMRDDAAYAQLEAWAAANGYEADPVAGEGTFVERYAPRNPDGTSTTKIFWAPLDGDSPTMGNAQEIVDMTGAPSDAILVVFYDFTEPQP